MKIGVISDLHLFKKTTNIEHALSKLQGVELLLIAGDIADRAAETQYNILVRMINDHCSDIPVYCVSGNHDNPARDDTNYRKFETEINSEYMSIVDASGAFYKYINDIIDLIGLNPVYHQKQFFFPDRGQQLNFLKEQLSTGFSKYHIVLCHPPLSAHNPQRTADMPSYIAVEQDKRLQRIIDENRNIILISGHTHLSPTIEFDAVHNNLYINDGSICPTSSKESSDDIQQGNVTFLEVSEDGISVIVKGIHTENVFIDKFIKM